MYRDVTLYTCNSNHFLLALENNNSNIHRYYSHSNRLTITMNSARLNPGGANPSAFLSYRVYLPSLIFSTESFPSIHD